MAKGTLNKVMLIGRLGADPEVRATPGGMYIAKLSVATNSMRKDQQTGERIEETEWHRVTLFNRQAEVAQQYLRKGSKIYVEGRIKTSKWQDQDGNDRYMTEIIGNDIQMLDSRNEGMGEQGYGGGYNAPPPAAPAGGGGQANNQQPPGAPPIMNDFDDDIPF